MTVCALIVSGTSRALPSCIAVRIRLFAALCFATLATVALALAGPAAAASRSTSDPAAVLQDTHAVGGAAATEEPAEHTLSQKAVEIARPFGFPITNSMVVTWLVALGLIVFARVATRSMNQVPSGAQNLLEWLIEGLYGLLESIIGAHLVKKTFSPRTGSD